MRKFTILITLFFSISLSFQGLSQQNTEAKDNLDELFEIMEMDATFNLMYEQIANMIFGNVESQDMSAERLAIIEKYKIKTVALMKEEMSWEVAKADIKQIYRQNFTDSEIADILAFYKSSTGQSLLRTMPVVMTESMQIGQNMAQQAMPKAMEIGRAMGEELAALEEQ